MCRRSDCIHLQHTNPDPDGVQQLGNNADLTVNVLPGAAIDTSLQPGLDDDGIQTGNGNDVISVVNGSVTGQDAGIETEAGNDQITVTNSDVASITSQTIESENGNDLVNVTNSVVTSIGDSVINTGNGSDVVNVSDSEVKVLTASGRDSGIFTFSGNDKVTVENSLIQGGNTLDPVTTAISLGEDDDTLTLGTGAVLRGLRPGNVESFGIIDCGYGCA